MHTLMKNSMIIPLVTVTFYYFGWWLYWVFPNGPFITGGIDFAAEEANTAMSSTMGANLDDRIMGYIIAKILNAFNYLRIPKEIELMGLDFKNNQDQKSAEEDVRQAEKALT